MEIAELKRANEHHPDVARYAYENMRLKDKLQRLHAAIPDCEEKVAEIEAMYKYQSQLVARVLSLEKKEKSLSVIETDQFELQKPQVENSGLEELQNTIKYLQLLSAEYCKTLEEKDKEIGSFKNILSDYESKNMHLLKTNSELINKIQDQNNLAMIEREQFKQARSSMETTMTVLEKNVHNFLNF